MTAALSVGTIRSLKSVAKIGKYIGEIFKGYDCKADVINYDATLYLTERIAHVNKHGYDLAMEIHLNAAGGTGARSTISTRARQARSSPEQSARA